MYVNIACESNNVVFHHNSERLHLCFQRCIIFFANVQYASLQETYLVLFDLTRDQTVYYCSNQSNLRFEKI